MKIGGKKNRKKNRKKRPRASWPAAQRWAATGTLVACTALSARKTPVLFAQDRRSPAPRSASPGQSNALLVRWFNIPPVISPKFPAPLLDTPQTIAVVPNQVIEDQGATTLRNTLRNVAGISLAAGEGGSQGDNLTIRGFTARNDIFLDGMRDFGSYYRDPFDLENVEVLQGPSGVMFGRGSTGGVVNQQSKTPNLDSFVSGGLAYGTDQTKRLTLDVNKPLPVLGEGVAFRLNLMGDEGGVAGRDITEERRMGADLSLALGLGTPTRIARRFLLRLIRRL